jgi:hypothetical protein
MARSLGGFHDATNNGSDAASQLGARLGDSSIDGPVTVEFKYKTPTTGTSTSTVTSGFGEPRFTLDPSLSTGSGILLAERGLTTAEVIARRFTQVQDEDALEPIVRALAVLEPSLTSLTLGFYPEREPVVRAHLGLIRPLPIAYLGEGASRLLDILMAIWAARGWIVAIDEIGRGLYYRVLECSWRSIDIASQEADTQIFATTHSLECVQAAVVAFSGKHADEFRLFRLERADSDTRVVTYDHETAEAAIDAQLEFR